MRVCAVDRQWPPRVGHLGFLGLVRGAAVLHRTLSHLLSFRWSLPRRASRASGGPESLVQYVCMHACTHACMYVCDTRARALSADPRLRVADAPLHCPPRASLCRVPNRQGIAAQRRAEASPRSVCQRTARRTHPSGGIEMASEPRDSSRAWESSISLYTYCNSLGLGLGLGVGFQLLDQWGARAVTPKPRRACGV